jgi:pyrroline-5-carboxylate reductase
LTLRRRGTIVGRMKERRIGFVGAGNMATALVRGLLTSGLVTADHLRASDPNPERLAVLSREHGVVTDVDNQAVGRWADLVVLAVKPQVADIAITHLAPSLAPGTLLVSIAAGISTASLEARLPESVRVVRAMPNTPAIAQAGATAIAHGARSTPEDLELARALFNAVGRVVALDEGLMNAVTGLSGSGPAYVMLVIEALADGGVKVGLSREAALLLATQTVLGSAKLLLETGEHPARLRDMVTSPGGTTIAGLHALESGGLRPALIDAVERATARAHVLGAKLAPTG